MTRPAAPSTNVANPAPPPLSSEQTIRHLALIEAVKTWAPAITDEALVKRAKAFADFIESNQ